MLGNVFRAVALAVGLGVASGASAVPLSFTDVVDPADVFVTNNKVNSPYAFVHDLLDDGFNPLTDFLTSVTLTLRFRDDGDQQPESVIVTLDGAGQGIFPIVSHATAQSPSLAVLQVAQGLLQSDGILSVVLNRDMGDYWFMDATLVVGAERHPQGNGQGDAPVPEPGGALLAAVALLAAGLSQRRRGNCRKT